MGQKLMGQPAPADTTCRGSVIDMCPDESVLILIKHCRDMKQQETRLRLITLLLLLSCMVLFLFTTRINLRKHENSGSSGSGSPAEPNQAYSQQERECSTDNLPTESQRLHIQLSSKHTLNKTHQLYVDWRVDFGGKYNKEERAIVIPGTGYYFVYVRIDLSCHEADFKSFHMELHRRSEGYDETLILRRAKDDIACTPNGRTLYVGELFDLLKGDQVSVWIEKGYDLIRSSSFGAFLT